MPGTASTDVWLKRRTEGAKLVADYARMSMADVYDLDTYTFKILFRDAYVQLMSETEEGRDYLESCHILTLTEPDRDGLRKRKET